MAEITQHVDIINWGDYLAVRLPPYESLKSTQTQVCTIYEAIDRHNAPKLLIDSRATRERVPVLELYQLGVYIVHKFGPRLAKLAVVVAAEAAYPDRFGENVLRNRGLDALRFIDDEQEALAWLLAHPPTSPP